MVNYRRPSECYAGGYLARQIRKTLLIVLLFVFSFSIWAQENFTVDVMGPLTVGNTCNINLPESQKAWLDFENNLKILKSKGVDAITTDVWWGLVETSEGLYRWEYYDRMSSIIRRVGLKWKPILSFHKLGDNANDPDREINLPKYILNKAQKEGLFYNDQKGSETNQVISVWGTKEVVTYYQKFVSAFLDHFKAEAGNIKEIYISLGPSGELRYPSYNKHSYPGAGELQAYSPLAVKKFKEYLENKYSYSTIALNRAWGTEGLTFDNVYPPTGDYFYSNRYHLSNYGKDFFDFYHESLIKHGKIMLDIILDVFNYPGSAFRNIPIGVKIPGVHWTIGLDDHRKRTAELFAGLVSTSSPYYLEPNSNGAGYEQIMKMIRKAAVDHFKKINVVFTCVEKMDDEDPSAGTKPTSLISWVINDAKRAGLKVEGENALPKFGSPDFWNNMENSINMGINNITLLRANDQDGGLFDPVYSEKGIDVLGNLKNFIDNHVRERAWQNFIGYVPVGIEEMGQEERQELIINEIFKKISVDRENGIEMDDIVRNNKDFFLKSGFIFMLIKRAEQSSSVQEKELRFKEVEAIYVSLKNLQKNNELSSYASYISQITLQLKNLKSSLSAPDMSRLIENIQKYFELKGEKISSGDEPRVIVESAIYDIKTLAEMAVEDVSSSNIIDVDVLSLQKMLYGTSESSFRDGLLYYLEWKSKIESSPDLRNEYLYQWSTLNYLYFGIKEGEGIDIEQIGGSKFLDKLDLITSKHDAILEADRLKIETRSRLMEEFKKQIERVKETHKDIRPR